MKHRDPVMMRARIIGISGKMHSGKTTVSDMICDQLLMSQYYPKTIKFADPLYKMQKAVYDIAGIDLPKTKDRKLLQWLGTDWGRGIDENIWLNLWRKDTRSYLLKFAENKLGVVIADDVRFNNEAQLIREMGGAIINIEADDETRKSRAPETFQGTSHSSESGIDPALVTASIYNTGDIFDLRQNVRYLILDGLI